MGSTNSGSRAVVSKPEAAKAARTSASANTGNGRVLPSTPRLTSKRGPATALRLRRVG